MGNEVSKNINAITYDIIGAAYEVRRTCGKGLLEKLL